MFPSRDKRRRAIGDADAQAYLPTYGDLIKNVETATRLELVSIIGQLINERIKLFGIIEKERADSVNVTAEYQADILRMRRHIQELETEARYAKVVRPC